MDVRFVIVAPPPARKSFKMRLPVVVGRGDDAKFRIQQDSVSRRHCEFSLAGGVVTVTDLGSTNGTFVAGTRIAALAATVVPGGAEVRIGGTVLRVEYAAPKHAAAAAAHEADTVPLPAATPTDPAAELPELESLPELDPVGETAAGAREFPGVDAEEPALGLPAFPELEPASAPDAIPAFPDVDPAPPPADGSFDFLAGDAAPPPAADDTLDDFFKSLS